MENINPKDVLYVTIKKVFFNQILSREKKEEYREFSEYWIRRLCIIEDDDNVKGFKPFKYIRLCVGYNKDREEALVEIKKIGLYEFCDNIPSGFEKSDQCFIIDLGDVVSKKLKTS